MKVIVALLVVFLASIPIRDELQHTLGWSEGISWIAALASVFFLAAVAGASKSKW